MILLIEGVEGVACCLKAAALFAGGATILRLK
jgi:hypothetical protein